MELKNTTLHRTSCTLDACRPPQPANAEHRDSTWSAAIHRNSLRLAFSTRGELLFCSQAAFWVGGSGLVSRSERLQRESARNVWFVFGLCSRKRLRRLMTAPQAMSLRRTSINGGRTRNYLTWQAFDRSQTISLGCDPLGDWSSSFVSSLC